MRRRSYVAGVGTATVAVLAGCLSGDDDDSEDDESESVDPDDLDPEAAVERMLEVNDVESLAEAIHSESPIHPDTFESDGLRDLEDLTPEEQAAVAEAMRGPEPPDPDEIEEILDDDWEYEIDDDQPDVELDGVDVLTDSATADEILELEYADFWFAETDLDSIVEEKHVFIVEVEISQSEETGPDPSLDDPTTWVLVNEGDELKFFWAGEEDTTPDDPEELYEEESIDEDDDVVEEIEWEPEPIGPPDDNEGDDDDDGDGGQPDDAFEELEEARIHLTDSPGIEAEIVRAESVVAGGERSFWEPEDMEADDTGYVPGGWADSWITVQYDPDGDQVVVTAITGDEEEVVHRETYEP